VLTSDQLLSTAENSTLFNRPLVTPGSFHGNTFAGDLSRSRRPVLTGPKDRQVQFAVMGLWFRLKGGNGSRLRKVPIDQEQRTFRIVVERPQSFPECSLMFSYTAAQNKCRNA
jgi:hypothetical protein